MDLATWREAALQIRRTRHAGVEEVRQILRSDNEDHRARAVWVVAGWGFGARDLARDIGEVLRNHPEHADAASAALLGMGDSGVCELVKSMQSPHPEARAESASRLAGAAISGQYSADPVLRVAMRTGLSDQSPDVRSAAAVALARLSGGADRAPEIRLLLNDPDPGVRVTVVGLLTPYLGRHAFISAAFDSLLDDPDDAVLRVVLRAFAATPTQVSSALPRIGRLMRHDLPSVRAIAAEAFGMQGANASPELRALLQDEQPTVRSAAVIAMEKISRRDPSDFTSHVLPLLRDPEAIVRMAVLETLTFRAWRSSEVAHGLIASGVLDDAEAAVRLAALKAIEANGLLTVGVEQALDRAVVDSDARVREAALRARKALGRR